MKAGSCCQPGNQRTLGDVIAELGEGWQRNPLYILLADHVPGSLSCQHKNLLFLNSENNVSIQELCQNLLRAIENARVDTWNLADPYTSQFPDLNTLEGQVEYKLFSQVAFYFTIFLVGTLMCFYYITN